MFRAVNSFDIGTVGRSDGRTESRTKIIGCRGVNCRGKVNA
jgi:hypothetical protein